MHTNKQLVNSKNWTLNKIFTINPQITVVNEILISLTKMEINL